MKFKVLLSAFFAFSIVSGFAQFGKIPPEATNNFKTKYPDATNVSWRSGLNSSKASFDQDKVKYTAEFNNAAQWVKTEGRLTYDKLPTEVADGLHKSMYNGWEHTELLKIEEKDKDVEYRIRVKKNTGITKKYLYFNPSGQLLRESTTL
jgi:hypothetical protein